MYGLQHQATFWAVDLAGFGKSRLHNPHDLPDVNTHAELLLNFCQQQRLQPQVVIGHSMGGMLTLKLALAAPEMLQRFALVCPVVTGSFGLGAFSAFVGSSFGQSVLQHTEPLWSLAQSDAFSRFLQAPPYLKHPVARARLVQDFKRTTWQAAVGALMGLASENLEPHLHKITHPALVIVGSKDNTAPPREGQLAAAGLPNARLVEFEHSHHQPLEEEPARFLRVIGHFLRGEPVGGNVLAGRRSVVLEQTYGRMK